MLNDNNQYVLDKKRNCLTLLTFKALAKYFAPSTPIWFPAKLRVSSVCVQNYDEYKIEKWRTGLTGLTFKASAKYCASSLPISLHAKYNVVSVYSGEYVID